MEKNELGKDKIIKIKPNIKRTNKSIIFLNKKI